LAIWLHSTITEQRPPRFLKRLSRSTGDAEMKRFSHRGEYFGKRESPRVPSDDIQYV
jgi:hypothetical protein